MSPTAKRRLGIALGLAGLGALVGALVYIGKKQSGSALLGWPWSKRYRYVPGRAKEAPLIGSRDSDGMHIEHRRAGHMPIEMRVASIQRLIYEGVHDPKMRKLAMSITAPCPERDGLCEAKALYDYMKSVDEKGRKRFRYTGDIAPIRLPDGSVEGIDLFQSAKRTDEFGGGDCDDAIVEYGTLASIIGLTTRLRVTAPRPQDDDEHIYGVVGLPKHNPREWVPVDVTLPGSDKFGVEVPARKVTDFDA